MRLNPDHSARKDASVALHELQEQERAWDEVSEREARRLNYRPVPHYLSLSPNMLAFGWTCIFGAAAVGIWLAKINHWGWFR